MTGRIVLIGDSNLAWSSDQFDTVKESADTTPFPAGDCYVVSAADYPAVREELRAARLRHDGAVLVVTDDPTPLHDDLGSVVDEVIAPDAPTPLIDHRVTGLLRRDQHELDSESIDGWQFARQAFETANTGVIITDPTHDDNAITYANRQFQTLTGYSESEVLGRNCRLLQGPGTDPEAVATLRAGIDAAEPTTVELLNYRKDGTSFWNRVTVLPIHDAQGTLTHFLGLQEDITDHREREAVNERYERIVQTAVDPIFALDSEGRVMLANEALAESLGITHEELVGSRIADHFDASPVESAKAGIKRALEQGQATYEANYLASNGRRRHFEVSVVPLRTDGTFVGTVQVSRDVTDVHEYERRLSVFDRVLRHNLRNKMNIVLARAEEIQREGSGASHSEMATGIVDAAEELLEMAENIRRFRAELDPANPTVRTCDLVEHVTNVLDETALAHPDVSVETAIPASAWVQAPTSVELIVGELLENAITHGEPPVRLAVESDDEYVSLHVIDHGTGIPAVERRALERGAETPLEHTQGLGLWLARWAAENADGDLVIDDDRTVVTLRLPRASPEERP